jgi:predicted membrane chloride channel (bestrophin family)
VAAIFDQYRDAPGRRSDQRQVYARPLQVRRPPPTWTAKPVTLPLALFVCVAGLCGRIAALSLHPLEDWRKQFMCKAKVKRFPQDDVYYGPEVVIPQQKRYTSGDWLSNLANMPFSSTLRRIASPVLTAIFWTLSLTLVHKFLWPFPELSSSPHSLLGGTLALLLTFRTNSAYTRFWEGRTIWQGVVDNTRNLSRLSCIYADAMGPECFKRITDLLCAYPILLEYHVEGKKSSASAFSLDNFGPDKRVYYDDGRIFAESEKRESAGDASPAEMAEWRDFCETFDGMMCSRFDEASNRPLFAASALAEEIRSIPDSPDGAFTNRERVAMLDLVAKLSTSIGACERLVQTPVPLSYARHTSRFLSLWCLTLPFVLVPRSGFIAAPVMALATWALFGIQEIGNWIEEPFRGSLKLGVLCDTVFRDVRETAKHFSALRKQKGRWVSRGLGLELSSLSP